MIIKPEIKGFIQRRKHKRRTGGNEQNGVWITTNSLKSQHANGQNQKASDEPATATNQPIIVVEEGHAGNNFMAQSVKPKPEQIALNQTAIGLLKIILIH